MRLKMMRRLFDDQPSGFKAKALGMYVILAALNVFAWLWAFAAIGDRPLLLATASLAYTLGLRHAVDPDHIAAIDNVTRKLMQDGKRPLGVGFFFALGHSTVVIVASIIVTGTVTALQLHFGALEKFGSIIGTSVSAVFLLIIAAANLVVLASVYRLIRRVKRNGPSDGKNELTDTVWPRGTVGRAIKSLFGFVTVSWHMFPLGFLFGLSFDTATEIALLGISATQSSAGLSFWSLLVFPVLFTAGMSLVDATDGVFMINAYGWALRKPMQKLYYNFIMTLVSIIFALLIGSIEVLGLVADKFNLGGRGWDFVRTLNENFAMLGYAIIAVFALSWLIATLVLRINHSRETGQIV
jgi:high-affinity nickel-transport protein